MWQYTILRPVTWAPWAHPLDEQMATSASTRRWEKAGARRGNGRPVMGAQRRDTVEGQRANVVAGEVGESAGRVVEGGEDGGVRVGVGQSQDHPLGASPLGQVVVDEGQ